MTSASSFGNEWPRQSHEPSQIAETLRRLASKYCWDINPDEAIKHQNRIILRVMDFGTLEDIFGLETLFGAKQLAGILKAAPAGALRPRSWSFWHYRLGLANAQIDPPPMPVRTFA